MPAPTVWEARTAIRDGQLGAAELLDACLAEIERWEPRLQSLLERFEGPAREAAAAADAELAAGRDRGPLHGIPVVVKDHIDVAGSVTTAGSPLLADNVAAADAPVIASLREAGAVILAKANTHELAFGSTTPPTRNPWNLDCIPGGSSGGSGAAIGAGLVPAALGTDSGASIREPAAFCGTVGLRPTTGRVSARGTVAFAWSLDAVGPMARTVEDCVLVQLALEGRDDELRGWTPDALGAPAVASLRLGVVEELLQPLQPDVRARFDGLLEALAAAGAQVDQVSIGDVDELIAALLVIVGSEAYAYQRTWVAERRELYSPDVLASVETGAAYSAVDYLDAARVRADLSRRISALLADREALLCPSALVTAPAVGATEVDFPHGPRPLVPSVVRPVGPFALAGQPAASVPIGLGPTTGMPVGAQLVGRPHRDLKLLAVARAVQSVSPWIPGTSAPV